MPPIVDYTESSIFILVGMYYDPNHAVLSYEFDSRPSYQVVFLIHLRPKSPITQLPQSPQIYNVEQFVQPAFTNAVDVQLNGAKLVETCLPSL